MVDKKVTICAFIHYSKMDILPYYAEIYIHQLAKHFDKIKVLTNNPNINKQDYFNDENIEFIHLENKGYDFGMFYRYFLMEDFTNVSQLGLVNDSNILLNELDNVFRWGNENHFDFWGIIDSNEKPWFSDCTNCYHLQSHFLVFNRQTLNFLPEFFGTLNIDEIFEETDAKKLRRLVIDKWEIGLTRFLNQKGLTPGSYIRSDKLHLKYKQKKQNLTHSIYYELVSEGYPLLKKKVILGEKSFLKLKRKNWKKTIDDFGNDNWDFKRILNSVH